MLTMILYVLHPYPVVQRLENAIHWRSVDKASEATWWIVCFFSGGEPCPFLRQPEPGLFFMLAKY